MAWTGRTRGSGGWSGKTRTRGGWTWDYRWIVTLGLGPAVQNVSVAMRGFYPTISSTANSWGKRGVSTATWTKR